MTKTLIFSLAGLAILALIAIFASDELLDALIKEDLESPDWKDEGEL